jgi:HEPN domain-containing protein
MEENIKRWIMKAENDLKIARDELMTEKPANDMICFHCQQAVEKYLKAFLVKNSIEFKKTHDISELIELCLGVDDSFSELFDKNVDSLTIYAAEIRYPDYFYLPSDDETNDAISKAEYVKDFVMRKLESER